MGKGFHIYIKDSTLVDIFNIINQERGELSAVITELAWNGMEKVVEKHLKKKTNALRQLKKADKTLKNIKKLRKSKKEDIYNIFKKRLTTSEFELDHDSNLVWIEKYADKLGLRPIILLEEFEKRYEKEKKGMKK